MIGSPIAHVRTPAILNAILERDDIAVRVVTEEVDESGLPGFLERMTADTLGLLVTMPLKTALCPRLDRRTAVTDLTGSTNCVRIGRDGSMTGATFDGFGLLSAIEAAWPGLREAHVLQVGCGGAGTAIAAALSAYGVASLTLADVATDRVGAYAEKLSDRFRRPVRLDDGSRGAFDIIINSSPVGMNESDPSPVSDARVETAGVVVDITSEPRCTALMGKALAAGRKFVGGTAMVSGQVELIRDFLLGDFRDELAVIESRRGRA